MSAPVPTPFRLCSDDMIQIGKIRYIGSPATQLGFTFLRADMPGVAESFTHQEMHELLASGDMKIHLRWNSESETNVRAKHGELQVADLPTVERHIVLWREDICRVFLRMENAGEVTRSDASMALAIPLIMLEVNETTRKMLKAKEEAAKQKVRAKKGTMPDEPKKPKIRCGTKIEFSAPPSPTQLRKWVRVYEEAGFNPIALRPGYSGCGNQKDRLSRDERRFFNAAIRKYLSRAKPTMASLYRTFKAEMETLNATLDEPLTIPCKRTFERTIKRLPRFEVDVARMGRKAALAKHAITVDGLDVTFPFERIEMDEWLIPLQTLMVAFGVWDQLTEEERAKVKRLRAWATVAIDCATRCITALRVHYQAPSGATALAALEMVVSDKTHIAEAAGAETSWEYCGTPQTVAMDSGPSWIAELFRLALRNCRIEDLYPPSGRASLRARQERFFKMLGLQAFTYMSGRSFESIKEKGDYESEKLAATDLELLTKILIRHVVDVYHNTPHYALGDETPRNCWLRLSAEHGVLPPPDQDTRRHIFGLPFERVISDKGIRVFGLHYQHPDIQNLRQAAYGEEVKIRVDPQDLGAISVFTGDEWITVPYCRRGIDMRGVTLSQWLAAAKDLARHHAELNKLSVSVVNRALIAAKATAEEAAARTGIASPDLTPEMLAAAEAEFFRAFDFADVGEGNPEDILGNMAALSELPKHDGQPAETPTVTSQPPIKRRAWKTED